MSKPYFELYFEIRLDFNSATLDILLVIPYAYVVIRIAFDILYTLPQI